MVSVPTIIVSAPTNIRNNPLGDKFRGEKSRKKNQGGQVSLRAISCLPQSHFSISLFIPHPTSPILSFHATSYQPQPLFSESPTAPILKVLAQVIYCFGAGLVFHRRPAPSQSIEWRFAAQVPHVFSDLRQKNRIPAPSGKDTCAIRKGYLRQKKGDLLRNDWWPAPN